ncbi:copper resistance protein CopC [Streptomyces sp. ME02-8801-2C]|uniref:copper resistance CopC/CopD family protein n=1 Tax=Streptomyces sp. ME02-8801-2C TaxID=3028680 RepID=UPI0029A692AE|nr:copper resistance protein CopC [Streptomyces sp. ME02-8801-2C]MDX3454181.1 copper resistance protein CopC [Streptomyces sp. ME02-8801-2C]
MTQTIAPRVRPLVLLFLAVAAALLAGLAGAAPVSAHAALTGSAPQQGVVVDKAPTQVTLTFSEKVAFSDGAFRVLDPKGKRVDTGKATELGGTTYGVPLHAGLPDGTYTVAYQVVSADSHPVAGAFTFSVGAPSVTSVSVSDQTAGGGVVGALYGFGRYVSYAGFIVMVGGAAFVLACWPRGSGVRAVQRLVVSGWLAMTAATLALLLMRGSYTGSGKVGDIFDLGLLGDVLQTKTGAALVSRLLLLAAGALFIAVLFGAYARPGTDESEDGEEPDESSARRDLTFGLGIGGGVVAIGLAATWALAEHASTGLQPNIAMPVDVLHLVAVALWLGGLAALLVALFRAPADTPIEGSAVRRFSRVAFGSVLALVATGIYQSWRQLGSWSAFTDTWYGQLLLIKIGLVVVLVGIAYISRRWTSQLPETAATEAAQPAEVETADPEKETVAAGATGGSDAKRAAQLARQQAAVDTARLKRLRNADPLRSGLRRSVLAETGVAVVLLAVTTVLTSTEPGRTEQEAKAATSASSSSSSSSSSDTDGTGALTLDMPFDTGGQDGKGLVRLDINPARVGGNVMHVYVERPNGRAFDVPEVKVAFTLTAKNIGPLPVNPDRIATGHWTANEVQIPMAGDWKIAVTVRTSDIDQVTVDKNAQIG